jgi:hypothetical protein
MDGREIDEQAVAEKKKPLDRLPVFSAHPRCVYEVKYEEVYLNIHESRSEEYVFVFLSRRKWVKSSKTWDYRRREKGFRDIVKSGVPPLLNASV